MMRRKVKSTLRKDSKMKKKKEKKRATLSKMKSQGTIHRKYSKWW